MILKNSQYRGEATLPWVLDTATGSRGQDRGGYRAEFISLVQRAMSLGASLGTALGALNPARARCRACGYEWE